MLVGDVINYLEERYPRSNAEDFDQPRIGFIVGSKALCVDNILLALDLTYEVVLEAIELNCNMIVTHHPFIFDPLFKLIFEDEKTKIISKLFEHKISVYSMHTNLDVANGGVNDCLVKLLGVENVKSLYDVEKGNFLKYGEIEELTLKEFALKVKGAFKLSGVRVFGDLNKKVKNVGIIGGSGAHVGDLNDAIRADLDAYVTGEIKLSNAQYAYSKGLNLIEVNHGVERFVFDNVKNELTEVLKKNFNFNNKVIISNVDTDKFITL